MEKDEIEVEKIIPPVIAPKYDWAPEDGAEFIAPVKRRINKTMEVTESFTYFDALKYSMILEKAIEDKREPTEEQKAFTKAIRQINGALGKHGLFVVVSADGDYGVACWDHGQDVTDTGHQSNIEIT